MPLVRRILGFTIALALGVLVSDSRYNIDVDGDGRTDFVTKITSHGVSVFKDVDGQQIPISTGTHYMTIEPASHAETACRDGKAVLAYSRAEAAAIGESAWVNEVCDLPSVRYGPGVTDNPLGEADFAYLVVRLSDHGSTSVGWIRLEFGEVGLLMVVASGMGSPPNAVND